MNLKISLSKGPVSGALLRSNLRTHWGWPCVMAILLCFNVLAVRDNSAVDVTTPRFLGWFYVSFAFGILYAVMTAAKLFSYLDKPNSVSFMHGIPVSRLKLYVTNLLSGGIIVMIPPVVACVLMLILQLCRAATCFRLYSVLAFLGVYAVYTLIAMAITVFAMVFCGNVIVSLLLSCGIVVLPAAALFFVIYVLSKNLYGYLPAEGVDKFLETLYVFPDRILSLDCLVYIIGGLLFLSAGYLIYAFRPLENAGEVVAFRKLRMLFTVVVGVVLGMISYLFFVGVFNIQSVLWMLPLGLVGVIGANMIARKTVGLRGSGPHILAYVLLTLLVSLSLKGDWFGYVHRVPELSDVKSVTISSDEFGTARLTDPEGISAVRELHTALADQAGKEMTFDYENRNTDPEAYQGCNISFSYTLRSGLVMRRSYDYIQNFNYTHYMQPLLDSPSVKIASFDVLDDTVTPIGATIYDDRISTPAETYGADAAAKLIEALRRDVVENTADELSAEDSALYIRFEFYDSNTDRYTRGRGYSIDEKGKRICYSTIHYNGNYTNLIAAIDELGYDIYNEALLNTVDELRIRMYDYYSPGYGYYSEKSAQETEGVSTELADIETAYSFYEEGGIPIATVTDPDTIRFYYGKCGFGWNNDEKLNGGYAVLEFSFIDTDAEDENKRIVFLNTYEIAEDRMPTELKGYVQKAVSK